MSQVLSLAMQHNKPVIRHRQCHGQADGRTDDITISIDDHTACSTLG